mgnify:CR=1 FL=1
MYLKVVGTALPGDRDTLDALAGISGVGAKKLQAYGEQILRVSELSAALALAFPSVLKTPESTPGGWMPMVNLDKGACSDSYFLSLTAQKSSHRHCRSR